MAQKSKLSKSLQIHRVLTSCCSFTCKMFQHVSTWPVAFTKNSRQRFYFRSVEATKDMSVLLFLPPLLLLLLLLFFVFFCSILCLTDNDLTTITKNMKVRFWTFSVTFSVTFSGIPKFARLKHGFWLLDMQVQRMTIMTPERTVSPVYTCVHSCTDGCLFLRGQPSLATALLNTRLEEAFARRSQMSHCNQGISCNVWPNQLIEFN